MNMSSFEGPYSGNSAQGVRGVGRLSVESSCPPAVSVMSQQQRIAMLEGQVTALQNEFTNFIEDAASRIARLAEVVGVNL
jgi:hypothetical protein